MSKETYYKRIGVILNESLSNPITLDEFMQKVIGAVNITIDQRFVMFYLTNHTKDRHEFTLSLKNLEQFGITPNGARRAIEIRIRQSKLIEGVHYQTEDKIIDSRKNITVFCKRFFYFNIYGFEVMLKKLSSRYARTSKYFKYYLFLRNVTKIYCEFQKIQFEFHFDTFDHEPLSAQN